VIPPAARPSRPPRVRTRRLAWPRCWVKVVGVEAVEGGWVEGIGRARVGIRRRKIR